MIFQLTRLFMKRKDDELEDSHAQKEKRGKRVCVGLHRKVAYTA